MSLYGWYRIGRWLATHLPRPVGYGISTVLGTGQHRFSHRDRAAVERNLAAILGPNHPAIPATARAVFVNFAKYLLDFFRLAEVDDAFLRRRVTMVGREHLDRVLSQGRGAIILSAHLGNYELGAAVMAVAGYPVNVIVLTHQDPRIDAFFVGQRRALKVRAISTGMALRQGFACLRRNELLGILADRDFFNNGVRLRFLGREVGVPKGPALFSLRTGAPLVPTFLIRDPGERFRLVFEPPIEPNPSGNEADEVQRMMRASLDVLERYIRQYPSQWYLFRDFWDTGPWVIR